MAGLHKEIMVENPYFQNRLCSFTNTYHFLKQQFLARFEFYSACKTRLHWFRYFCTYVRNSSTKKHSNDTFELEVENTSWPFKVKMHQKLYQYFNSQRTLRYLGFWLNAKEIWWGRMEVISTPHNKFRNEDNICHPYPLP